MPKSGNFSPAFSGSLSPAATRGWKRVKISDWESQDVKCELGFVDSDVAELFKKRSYAVEKAALTSE